MRILQFSILLCAFFGARLHAQTINAASCNSGDVQSALNSVASDGTIVNIPAGNCTWKTQVIFNQVYSTVIQGRSTTSGTCAPGGTCTATDSTIINDEVAGTGWTFNTAAGKSLRITGITFNPSGATPAYGAITIGGSSTSIRVDHSHFVDTVSGEHTFQIDQVNGVFDHNVFDSTNSANLFFFQFTDNGASNYGHESWAQPENFGTSKFIYIENNLFQNGAFMFDCFSGGRAVLRFNIVGYNTRIQTHGLTGDTHRGCRTEEVYGNSFTFSNNPSSNSFAFLVDYEGGNGMWWGNTITGFVTFLREDVVRTNSDTYSEVAPPAGWGYCSGASPWDGNVPGQNGWPCLDGIGRGAGQLLSGCLASSGGACSGVVNTATGTIAWPNEAAVPVYAWANTFNTSNFAPPHYWSNYDSVSVENRDYYLELPNYDEPQSFNGTAGIGQGKLASKPATCTPGVGWWATDQGTWNQSSNGFGQGELYVCTATNTWTPFYIPYTYPHPLTQQGGTSPISPPTNLSATVQ